MEKIQEPSLQHANALLREGNYREAVNVFHQLLCARPGYISYEQGYVLALKRLGEGVVPNSPDSATFSSESVHPKSKPIDTGSAALFVVVTPVLNGEKFLKLSLDSVLNQSGNFFVDYFVKDGGSTDSTLEILRKYSRLIAAGDLPLQCNGIRFRVESSPDNGLYDAVGQGFARPQQRAKPIDIMTYINADDVLAADAFETAAHVFSCTPARWICGQTNVINESGELIVSNHFPVSYAREDIRAGLHDGRSLYVIQQEGSFWLRDLYDEVGGVNRSLKLAGDFDLWKRFATQTELLALSRPLASFRSHVGQLSEQMEKYYAEIELIQSAERNIAEHASEEDQDRPYFYLGHEAPLFGVAQRQGPVCFLNANGSICEIAYIKRGWYEPPAHP